MNADAAAVRRELDAITRRVAVLESKLAQLPTLPTLAERVRKLEGKRRRRCRPAVR